ncbi:MAG TPA: cytidine deaminase [Salinimicrobium sp.]|nr:cytidine deaminase [Salinimicrobium sp.]
MKEIKITSVLEVYESLEELPRFVQDLFEDAVNAREKAYAPYSQFNVGAAILLQNGEIITGSNQENASYPSGLCAERTAVFFAGAKFPNEIIKCLVVTAKSANHLLITPVPPCGACRQVIAEYEERQEQPIEIYFMGERGKVVKASSLKDLLPFSFDKSCL